MLYKGELIYRVDYFQNGKWTTWGTYEDINEAKETAQEHYLVYDDEDVRIVPVPKYVC